MADNGAGYSGTSNGVPGWCKRQSGIAESTTESATQTGLLAGKIHCGSTVDLHTKTAHCLPTNVSNAAKYSPPILAESTDDIH